MEILEDEKQRLFSGLAQEQMLDGVEGLAATLRGIEHLPARIARR